MGYSKRSHRSDKMEVEAPSGNGVAERRHGRGAADRCGASDCGEAICTNFPCMSQGELHATNEE